MGKVTRDHTAEIKLAILRYLKSHPNAADTTDGIRRWWLPSDSPDSAESVIRVIKQLESDLKLESGKYTPIALTYDLYLGFYASVGPRVTVAGA